MTTETDQKEVVGVDAPVSRTNANHPLTGKIDHARESVGDRRRVEWLEFTLGRVVCGHRSRTDATYCTEPPEPGQHRCKKHLSAFATARPLMMDASRYKPTAHKFYKCSRCSIKPCEGRVEGDADVCVYEVEQYEALIAEAATLSNYGPTTQHLFAELVWTLVVISRLERQITTEGTTVVHIDGAANVNGVVQFIKNDSEHPILKHLAKMQQAAKQLATELELTPKAQTGKGAVDNESNFRKTMDGLWKQSVQSYKEQQQKVTQ